MAEGLFPPPKPEKRGKEEVATPAFSDISRLSSRLRMLEDTIHNLRTRLRLTDQNLLTSNKAQNAELKSLGSDINKLKQEMFDLKDQINMLRLDLKTSARKEDLITLKKYIDLWQPLNFVTRDEVEKIIKELINEQNEKV